MQRLLILILCSALIAIFVGGLFALTTPTRALESDLELDVALAEWEALGGTTDLMSLALPAVPDAVNAAVHYRRTFAGLIELDEEERRLLDAALLHTRPDQIMAIADRLEPVVRAAREASDQPACAWSPGYYQTGAVTRQDLSDQAGLLELSVAVAAHALDRAEAEDLDAAVDDLVGLRRMALHASSHPDVTYASTGLLIDLMAFEVIELVYRDRPIARHASLLSPRDYFAELRSKLVSHGAAGLIRLDDPSFGPASRAGWQRDRDKISFLHAMCECLRALDPANGMIAPPQYGIPVGETYTEVLLPGRGVFEGATMVTIRSAMAGVAIDLRAHREARGAYPEDWPMPAHPATGRPLQYRREGRGFVLSTGVNERLDWRWD